jgi:hypothetical protein
MQHGKVSQHMYVLLPCTFAQGAPPPTGSARPHPAAAAAAVNNMLPPLYVWLVEEVGSLCGRRTQARDSTSVLNASATRMYTGTLQLTVRGFAPH